MQQHGVISHEDSPMLESYEELPSHID